ncbi:Rv1733c family protein [Actinokineospora bangkokensis]|uniref:Transmembrane protein n=1 Tax=Actinokineospora bangkokensis TaxID=1193682 RepID=A0A1Q9LR02_9PSEU|nr:hypothetical protein [Actinokineospora bangkokensis]OLR94455.1 hypothetical protein BJP25_11930 [Actinokineospora bangkokensis]
MSHPKLPPTTTRRLRAWWSAVVAPTRPIDRVQALISALLVVTALCALPFAAAMGTAVHERWAQRAAVESVQREPRTATLLADVPMSTAPWAGTRTAAVPARWTGADGVEREADVDAAEGSRAGERTRIWVDRTETPVPAPATAAAAVVVASVVAVISWLVACAVLGLLRAVVVSRVDRARARAWSVEWERVEPRWSHRAR